MKYSEVKLIYRNYFGNSRDWEECINEALADKLKKVHTFEFNDDHDLFIIVYHIEKRVKNANP